jgi:hypothetical protein
MRSGRHARMRDPNSRVQVSAFAPVANDRVGERALGEVMPEKRPGAESRRAHGKATDARMNGIGLLWAWRENSGSREKIQRGRILCKHLFYY